MRATSLFFAALLGATAAAPAVGDTPKVEVAAGYSTLRYVRFGVDDHFGRGWNVAVAYNTHEAFAIVADVSRYHKVRGGDLDFDVYSLLGGVRFAYRKAGRVVPFFQGLVGAEPHSEDVVKKIFFPDGSAGGVIVINSYTHLSIQPGGGIDIKLSRHLAARLQADWRVVLGYRNPDALRFVFGVNCGFGSR